MDKTLQESLSVNDDAILPFIPYLLQDLWSLGGHPYLLQSLVTEHCPLHSQSKILELGCGKGANLLQLALQFPGQYFGIDLMADFIEEGQRICQNTLATTQLPSDKLQLYAGDLCDYLDKLNKYDLIIYAHDADILGCTEKTLISLHKGIKPNAHLVYETIFGDNELAEYFNLIALDKAIKQSGFRIVAQSIWPDAHVQGMNRANNTSIAKRCRELGVLHPEHQALFKDYLCEQIRESGLLETQLKCVTFVLQAP